MPAEQFRQASDAAAPTDDDHVPAMQLPQANDDVAARLFDHVPATHPLHVDAPVLAHVPARQFEQVADANPDHDPAAQSLHESA